MTTLHKLVGVLENRCFYECTVCTEATGSSVYDNKESLGLEHGRIRQAKGGGGNIGITVHDEPEYVEPPPEVPMGFSTNGFYDNPAQILGNIVW